MKTKAILQIKYLFILIIPILFCANTWVYKNNKIGIVGDFIGFSPDGKQIVTKKGKNSIKLWDLETEKEIKTFENKSISFKGFSPDGKKIVTSVYNSYWGEDVSLILWDVESGREIKTINRIGKNDNVNWGGFSPDGKLFVTYQLVFYESEEKSVLYKWKNAISFRTLYSVWDVASGEVYRIFSLDKAKNGPIYFLQDSKQMYSFEAGMRWNIDITDNNNEFHIRNEKSVIANGVTSFAVPYSYYNASISPDEKYFFSYHSLWYYGMVDMTHFTIQDFKTGEMQYQISKFHYDNASVYLNWETKQLYALIGKFGSGWGDDRYFSLFQWDIEYGTDNTVPFNSYKKTFNIGKTKTGFAYPLITPDGKYILIADKKNVILRDIENYNVVKTFTGHTKNIYSLHCNPNMKNFISVSADKTIRIWDF